MGWNLKPGKKYVINKQGDTISDAYAKIALVYDRRDDAGPGVTALVMTYSSKESADNRVPPYEVIRKKTSGDNFETYFNVDVINPEGENHIKAAYNYWKNETEVGPVVGNFDLADWNDDI